MQAKRPTGKSRFQSTLPAGEATVFPVIDLAGPRAISIHASRGGSDGSLRIIGGVLTIFQSTLPAGEATLIFRKECPASLISIHASRGGSDNILHLLLSAKMIFQSTLPAGEATQEGHTLQRAIPISIHASRGGSDPGEVLMEVSDFLISIHASRGGSDGRAGEALTSRQHFNPRFPRGKRHGHRDLIAAALEFQSTLPAGEATQGTSFLRRYLCISIHASRGGSDLFVQSVGSFLLRFQSTLPAGEATFYFRALVLYTLKFQSTLPAGEATAASLDQ